MFLGEETILRNKYHIVEPVFANTRFSSLLNW